MPRYLPELLHDQATLLVDVQVPLQKHVDPLERRLVVAKPSLVKQSSLLLIAAEVAADHMIASLDETRHLAEQLGSKPKHPEHRNRAQDRDDGHHVGGMKVPPQQRMMPAMKGFHRRSKHRGSCDPVILYCRFTRIGSQIR